MQIARVDDSGRLLGMDFQIACWRVEATFRVSSISCPVSVRRAISLPDLFGIFGVE